MPASDLLERGGKAAPLTVRPCRVQRSRRKGSQLPAGAVYVGRPGLFGNPFGPPRFRHVAATRLFARWLAGDAAALTFERLGFSPAEIDALSRRRARLLANLPQLAGRHLACWCPLSSRWCHADILLAHANAAT